MIELPVTGYAAGRMGALSRKSLVATVTKLRREAERREWDANAIGYAVPDDDPKVVRLWTDDNADPAA